MITCEICQQCAECCRNFPFVPLSQDEVNSLEQITKLHFSLFTNPIGEKDEGYFFQFQENGDCFFLKEKDGKYACGIYESRLAICRNFPAEGERCSRWVTPHS